MSASANGGTNFGGSGRRELPVDYLRECFDYSVVSGRLYWKQRPEHHFPKHAVWKWFTNVCAGKPVGAGESHGYCRITVTHNGRLHHFYAHRLIWALVMGHWPVRMIDHANTCGTDNRWLNLREASAQDNQRNSHARRHNQVGLKWVQRAARGTRFVARATVNKKTHHFGTFDTAEEAHLAAAKRLAAMHGEFLRTGSQQ